MRYQPPKGTQDLWGERFYAYDAIAKTILKVTEQYGFRQIRTPGFEPIDILAKDAGSEVTDQMYTFEDKGGRSLAIKSDITPAVTRFIAGNSRPMQKPIKVVCYDRVYRYESPQAGRNREITQINAEMFGAKAGLAEAEVITCLYQCYVELGLPEVVIDIGYRPLLVAYVGALLQSEDQVMPVIRLIDKKDKMSQADFEAQARSLGLDSRGLERVQLLLSLQGPFAATVKKARQALAADQALLPYLDELEALAVQFKNYGITKQYRLNLGLARGFDYYTGIILEAKLPGSSFGSIGGGGRYDNLVASYGGPETPAVGWSVGLDRICLVLESVGRLENLTKRPQINYYIATERDRVSTKAATVYAQGLRNRGANVEVDLLGKNMSEQLQTAKELGAQQIVLFKQKNVETGEAVVLDVATGTDTTIRLPGYE